MSPAPESISATSAYDRVVPTTVIPSGSRITSASAGTRFSIRSRNCPTLSCADFEFAGRRFTDATFTFRAAGAVIASNETSSHHTVPKGAFDRYKFTFTAVASAGAGASTLTFVHDPSRAARYTYSGCPVRFPAASLQSSRATICQFSCATPSLR